MGQAHLYIAEATVI